MIMILLHLVQTAIYSGKCSDSDKVVQLKAHTACLCV